MIGETELQQELDLGTEQGICPGAVLLISVRDCRWAVFASGYHDDSRQVPTQSDDLFDLASLTKVLATTSAVMSLVEAGSLDLDRPIGLDLPEFLAAADDRTGRASVTPRHLLAHCSGLPAHAPLWRLFPDDSRDEKRRRVLEIPLAAMPGTQTCYSDIGMMVLGFLIEDVTGRSLDRYVMEKVFEPLRMYETGFLPSEELRPRILPTEVLENGKDALHGIVHDENARWLGGIAGHAGLFGPAADIARFADCILVDGLLPSGTPLWSPGNVSLFTRRAGTVPGSSRCLGWDGYSTGAVAGANASVRSFGHTGFTGTSLWIDPVLQNAVILLTNAIHPTRDRRQKGYFEWRRKIHTLAGEFAFQLSSTTGGGKPKRMKDEG